MRKLIGVFAIACALGATPLVAQQEVPAQRESLKIGPGDLLVITLFDTPEMSQEARVSDAGTVRLQFIGDMKITGYTSAQAAKAIEDALTQRNIMKAPQVTVKIKEYATQDVSVLGEVKGPGTYEITTPQSVLKIISLAGGLTDSANRMITIERHDNPSEKLDYYLANDPTQALQSVPVVYPGDTVIVPRAPVVYIMGDVARPGGYSIATNDSKLTILQLVAMAGSTNKTSKTNLRLIRKSDDGDQQEVPIHLAEIQKGKQPDIFLRQGDILYVPFSWMKNTAMNAASIAASTSGAAIYALH